MRHNGGNTLQSQDHHEGLRALPLKAMECELSGFVRLGSIVVYQRAETRILGSPLPPSGAFRAHRTQPLELGTRPLTKASEACLHTLRQPLGCTDQIRQTTLP